MTPRRRARLQLYSFIFLGFTLALYSILHLLRDEFNSTAKERDLYFQIPEEINVGLSTRIKQLSFSKYVEDNDINKREGIQAPSVKNERDKMEEAPRGIDKYFKRNLILKEHSPNGERREQHGNNSNNIDANYEEKPTRMPSEARGFVHDDPGENAKFRNLSSKMIKFEDKQKSKTLTASDGTLPLMDQSELIMNLYSHKQPLIPHIVHQTWDTHEIPQAFIPWITSVVEKHPDWIYLFWTQDDVQCYFRNRFPDFVELYNSYWATIFKTDVMRYFLLYDIGGFYLDLDVECLKPLEIWSHYAPCLLSHETYEHLFLIRDGTVSKPNVMTSVLASRPHHPYFKLLQDNLARYHDIYKADVLRATGPYFMQEMLELYLERNYSRNSSEDTVTVLNPMYWLPTFDPVLKAKIQHRCTNRYRQLKKYGRGLCDIHSANGYKNEPPGGAYLNHHWVHTNLKPVAFKHTNLIDIRTILPNLINVTEYLGLKC